jgi:hypothetical protein
MPETSPVQLLGYLLAFVGAGGLIGVARYVLEWRKAPADRAYTIAQTDVQHATAEQIRHATKREDESSAVANLNVALQALKDSVSGLKDERDYWKARAEKAERRPLEEELKRLPETPEH